MNPNKTLRSSEINFQTTFLYNFHPKIPEEVWMGKSVSHQPRFTAI
ncbi:hypothetical protein HMPREF1051_1648 [Neisseria sicca VK64]|uniref:Uncharacterized protein n=1 Tax=Neisseria sicca VK64 TaxID=1095748 RepID=I2NXG5_NEISI|nr:hypothetical protein HMPREF1051_1648 [Neisseria sicca VK64]